MTDHGEQFAAATTFSAEAASLYVEREATLRSTADALTAWIDAVAVRFPWRARLFRRMVRSPFWCSALLKVLVRRA